MERTQILDWLPDQFANYSTHDCGPVRRNDSEHHEPTDGSTNCEADGAYISTNSTPNIIADCRALLRADEPNLRPFSRTDPGCELAVTAMGNKKAGA